MQKILKQQIPESIQEILQDHTFTFMLSDLGVLVGGWVVVERAREQVGFSMIMMSPFIYIILTPNRSLVM